MILIEYVLIGGTVLAVLLGCSITVCYLVGRSKVVDGNDCRAAGALCI